MKLIYLNLICALLTVTTNTLFKYILKENLVWKDSVLTFALDLFYNFKNPLLVLTLFIFILTNSLWIFILSTQNLSFALPFQIALVFLISIAFSYFIFNEKFTFHYVVGLVFIIIGIILISIANESSND
jgi:drug/metabolite transporter (DMT)-like permease